MGADVVIRGGTVVDGTGAPWFQADVAVRGGRIAAIGDLHDRSAREVIDASGEVVTPGFIDMHTHSDWTLLKDGRGMSKIMQGVTTEVIGEGVSVAPRKADEDDGEFGIKPDLTSLAKILAGGLPGGAVVGLVSEYDLLAREGETAGEVMTGSVISVSEDTDVDDVRHLLVERRIRRVPVISGQRLAGIVSRGDVVALLSTEWVCQVCGEAARGQHPPPRCPRCHAGSDRFILQDACPGD